MKKLVIMGIALFFAAASIVIYCCIEVIKPRDLTRTRMTCLRARILNYYEVNHKLPESLSDLPQEENRDNATTDGWGRPIDYATNNNNVTLMSFGKDGRLGEGAGEDADIMREFSVTTGIASRLSFGARGVTSRQTTNELRDESRWKRDK
jgi:hypothetical protein